MAIDFNSHFSLLIGFPKQGKMTFLNAGNGAGKSLLYIRERILLNIAVVIPQHINVRLSYTSPDIMYIVFVIVT